MDWTKEEINEIRGNLKRNRWRGKKAAAEYMDFVIQSKAGNYGVRDLIKGVLNGKDVS